MAADNGDSQLEELQKRLGFTHSANNVFLDRNLLLGMVSIFSYDWPHCYLQGGVFNVEAAALLALLLPHSLGAPTLHVYLQKWRWPQAYAGASQICKNGVLNGSISECLSVTPVFAKYITDVVLRKGVHVEACRCMLLLIDVLALLQRCQWDHCRPTPLQLESGILTHLRKQQAVYGYSCWIPKSHFSVHLPASLEKLGFLLSSTVLERKHKNVKRALLDRCTLTSYERTVMESLTVQHIFDLAEPLCNSDLKEPTVPSGKTLALLRDAFGEDVATDGDVFVAAECTVHSRAVHVGDAACYAREAGGGTFSVGQVEFICKIRGSVYICMQHWFFLDRPTNALVRYRLGDALLMVDGPCVRESLIFSAATLGEVSQVLVPPHLRHADFS